ncbi:MAG: substrate-binding domain-containing protein [Oscillospiraceae bacterium]|nr:substrate-binding domain-containing protein [Oscillospiraceae bacterium]
MKKFIAITLAATLCLSLFACSGGGETTTTPESAPPESDSGSPPESPDSEISPEANPSPVGGKVTGFENFPDGPGGRRSANASDYFGFWNPRYDYSNEPSYKFVFISMAWDNLTQRMADNWKTMAEMAGSEFTSTSCDSNIETMISNIELYATQGYDGMMINVYDAIMARVVDLCAENDITWWSISEVAHDSDGNIVMPYVVTNSKQWGYDLVRMEIEWMRENVADFDPSKTMILVESLTTIKEFTDRTEGAERAWRELLPEAKFEASDGLAEGGITPEIGYSMAATRFTANPDVEYWIYATVMDTFTPGILRFVEENGLDDRCIISCCGGDDVIPMFEAGTNGAWRFTLMGDLSMRFNSAFTALYAQVAGWCSFEEMWPDSRVPGEAYSGIDVAYIRATPENYRDYLAFTDAFTGLDNYPWEWSGKLYPVVYSDMEPFANGELGSIDPSTLT